MGVIAARLTALMVLAGVVFSAGLAHAQSAGTPDRVSGKQMSILLRTTMVALHHGNMTGNYTVLRDLGAQSFRKINTASRLSDIFRPLRKGRLDLSGTVMVDPILTAKAVIDRNGLLTMSGYFPIKPLAPVYRMGFRWEDRRWRLFSISVGAEEFDGLQGKKQTGGKSGKTSRNK